MCGSFVVTNPHVIEFASKGALDDSGRKMKWENGFRGGLEAVKKTFQMIVRVCAMFGLMLSLVHCEGLFGAEEEEDCTLGQIQPCDCLLDGQLAIGTQVCGLYGEYGDCECDSDGNGQGNEGSEGSSGAAKAAPVVAKAALVEVKAAPVEMRVALAVAKVAPALAPVVAKQPSQWKKPSCFFLLKT